MVKHHNIHSLAFPYTAQDVNSYFFICFNLVWFGIFKFILSLVWLVVESTLLGYVTVIHHTYFINNYSALQQSN